ncbi:iron chelate uptake ABC transporter family permease subunit [Mangrovibrevibacter kandeliae]|uniref:iron chelate uptake ABC transporter family permease subunit n=1 Tax=Mangrovibrevibacter kandeliae TaxID=2968473 RepID=UPI0021197F34|nr:iron chelate uptake ABC transporter family permease subunit [Aurantimonas sp. CSK15Z-1]MCQ8780567.1 iron ABC transporter permease [Aurantimonas sp. CSK15Z-1]
MKGAIVLLAVLLVASAASILIGEVPLGLGDLWQGMIGGGGPGALTVRVIRAPRAAVALGAGAALGLSGAAFQTLLRNPLAAPDLLGFTSGAGLAILLSLTLGLTLPLPLVGAAGGLATAVLVAVLAHRQGRGLVPITVILVGIGTGFTISAFGTLLMTRLPGAEAAEAQRWLTGSLAARDWGQAMQVWCVGGALAALLALQGRALDLLSLGDDLAAGLGLRVGRARLGVAATGVGLAAAGVAVAGPVPFVALMAGPLGARLTGARGVRGRLMAAAGAGAAVTLLADLASRVALPGIQLPIGVFTGVLGAPYLLWRLSREMEKGEL